MTSADILNQLVAMTPLPPPGADIALLIATFEAILEQRASLVASLTLPLVLATGERGLLDELERRQVIWQDVLATAQRAVAAQRSGAAHLRDYAHRI